LCRDRETQIADEVAPEQKTTAVASEADLEPEE